MAGALPDDGSPSPRRLRSSGSKENERPSAQQLFNHLRKAILEATASQELVYQSIDPASGLRIAFSLDQDSDVERALPRIHYNSEAQILAARIMPTEMHDTHQRWINNEKSRWLVSGSLMVAENNFLDVGVGTSFKDFRPPYASSFKQPDLFIRPDTQSLPQMSFEGGWTESWPRLARDTDLWLIGGAPVVRRVIISKWSKVASNNQATGKLEVWGRDSAGSPRLLQTETIFPVPAPALAAAQRISFTRHHLFGSAVFAGRNPSDIFDLSIDELRQIATERLSAMGLTPA